MVVDVANMIYTNNRLGVPIPFDTQPSFDQTLYKEGYNVIRPYVQTLLNKAYKYEEGGDLKEALCYFRSANHFVFVLNYLFIIYRYKKLMDQNPELNITGAQISSKYKFDCVYKGLSCYGCGEPIQEAFRDIAEILGLYDVIASAVPLDCEGIGKMIIGNGDNDFNTFIVGDICLIKDLNKGKTVSSFATNSFKMNSFEQTIY